MEDVIKLEARDFVISGIEKYSGGGQVNFEVFVYLLITAKGCLQVRQRGYG